MASRKTPVIEALFNARWNATTNSLSNPLVTLQDVEAAIQTYNQTAQSGSQLSTGNLANFFKDFIRKKDSANGNWPTTVLHRGYTARQVTGANRCFEFVQLAAGQTVPFPLTAIPAPTASTPRRQVESVSMPLASRRLGRTDESWLLQVVVRLRVLETHLSLVSGRHVVQMDLLQLGVKLSGTEIDALFLVVEEDRTTNPPTLVEVLVTCEAKPARDDILEDQVLAQAQAVFLMQAVTQNAVVPMAVKTVGLSEIHVVEFGPVTRAAPATTSLTIASQAVYELVPPVPGIR
jgi:hypothetical protein